MSLLACLLLLTPLVSVDAMPYPIVAGSVGEALSARDDLHKTYAGEPPTDRSIFVVISLFFTMILSLLLGMSRVRNVGESIANTFYRSSVCQTAKECNDVAQHHLDNCAHPVSSRICIYLLVSYHACRARLVQPQSLLLRNMDLLDPVYCMQGHNVRSMTAAKQHNVLKCCSYIFIVERIHVVRAPFVRRSRDWLYWSLMVMVVASFLGVAINAYLKPIIEMQDDGRCHMGIPGQASIPFMVVDISVNAALTAVFFYLLRPVVKLHGLNTISGVFGKNTTNDPDPPQAKKETAVQRNIRILLWKSLFGSMLIMLPTIANMVQFYITGGRELALICLSLCVADVSWDAVVIHWLTFGSAEAEKELTRSAQESLRSMRAPTPGSLRPRESQEVILSPPQAWKVDSVDEKYEAREAITPAKTP